MLLAGWTQADLAREAGVGQATVSRFCNGGGWEGAAAEVLHNWVEDFTLPDRLQAQVKKHFDDMPRKGKGAIKAAACEVIGISVSTLNKWMRDNSNSKPRVTMNIHNWWEGLVEDPHPGYPFMVHNTPSAEDICGVPTQAQEDTPDLESTPDIQPVPEQPKKDVSDFNAAYDDLDPSTFPGEPGIVWDKNPPQTFTEDMVDPEFDPDLDGDPTQDADLDPLLAYINGLDLVPILRDLRLQQLELKQENAWMRGQMLQMSGQIKKLQQADPISSLRNEAPGVQVQNIPKDQKIVMWVRGYVNSNKEDHSSVWNNLYTKFRYTPGGFDVRHIKRIHHYPESTPLLNVVKGEGRLDLLYAVARRYFKIKED